MRGHVRAVIGLRGDFLHHCYVREAASHRLAILLFAHHQSVMRNTVKDVRRHRAESQNQDESNGLKLHAAREV